MDFNVLYLVFSAACFTSLPGSNERIPYDVVLVDTADGFNDERTTYTVKSSGFYFTHMSAGVPAYR